jgi:cobalamin biosynthesis Co2+ chelatase CbiK/predicted small lipoprotein YifL
MYMKKVIAVLLALTMVFSLSLLAGCGSKEEAPKEEPAAEKTDEELAKECADLIDAIYVQEWTEETEEQCKAAKAAWDALTDEQKEMVEGEEASPDYFGADTGDASKDDPLNEAPDKENELLVVSFGTSFNDSRAEDIGGIEKALAKANPDWAVRRAFTAQIIINHVFARDGEQIDNVDQALQKAIDAKVKNLVIQPTHLMHGAEYDELVAALDKVKDKFESVKVAEPLLGEVGKDAKEVNADKEAMAKALVAEAVAKSDFDSLDKAAEDGTAFVFMGHGTSHVAAVTYDQMQAQFEALGYKNVFVGTVEGNPADTALPEVKKAVEKAGYKKVILRPMMVVAGDHANNDMAGDEEGSWYYGFVNGGEFEVEGADKPVDIGEGLGKDNVTCQIEGLGRIADIQKIYVQHTADALK